MPPDCRPPALNIGVSASLSENPEFITLVQIDRHAAAPKGRGAEFLRALCAYADQHHKSIYATVTGCNSALEDYYAQFGFAPAETGDVTIVREPQHC